MFAAIAAAFTEAFRNLRNNFFQTFLSVLGIIIGVGALVTMLALIDGLEAMARGAISENSSLESVFVQRNTYRKVDGVSVDLERTVDISRSLMDSVLTELPYPVEGQLYANGTTTIPHPDSGHSIGVIYTGVSLPLVGDGPQMAFGRALGADDQTDQRAVTTINYGLAERLAGEGGDAGALLNRTIALAGRPLTIVGIQEKQETEDKFTLALPLTELETMEDLAPITTAAVLDFARLEDVRPGKEFVEEWFATRYPDIEEPVRTRANVEIVEQMEQGIMIFRLVMTFLIGIAVVVGGVGVMNVLLMSITERTAEIGVRKAVGANRRRIMTQFLSESVAIASIGSVFGLVLGAALAIISAAVISHFAKFEFSAVFSVQTMIVVGVVAVLTGVVFGTYPARRAAGMDPVRAIQRS